MADRFMTYQGLRIELLAVCREFAKAPPEGAVFREPYVPYISDSWNGVLTLAEAQNLAGEEYRTRLEQLGPDGRFERLQHGDGKGGLGIEPWDNGLLKVGLMAAHPELDVEEVAVSNAVPWSWVKDGRKNVPTSVPELANPPAGGRHPSVLGLYAERLLQRIAERCHEALHRGHV